LIPEEKNGALPAAHPDPRAIASGNRPAAPCASRISLQHFSQEAHLRLHGFYPAPAGTGKGIAAPTASRLAASRSVCLAAGAEKQTGSSGLDSSMPDWTLGRLEWLERKQNRVCRKR